MHLPLRARKTLVCCFLALATPASVFAQASFRTNGAEYAIAGAMPGDQVRPSLSLKPSGGYLVWEDNVTDGDGLGISALRLDSSFSASLSAFRVNQAGAGDQERARVSVLNDGGAAFVWQGGKQGFQNIYARFLSASNTWLTGDVLINASTNNSKLNPAIATLTNGNVIVAWASFDQQSANSLQDVYGQLLSPAGQKIGSEFPINQFTPYNQRTPAVAALAGGGFVVVWVSEQQRLIAYPTTNQYFASSQLPYPSVDIYARLYDASGLPIANEFTVNTGSSVCANPCVAAGSDGSFMVGWGEKDLQVRDNGWDIFARPFSSAGVGGTTRRANTQLYGDQFAPQLSANGTSFLMAWTSMGQDGSMEGVYGQFLQGDGSASGGEFRANTTTFSKQMHQAVAADGNGRFLVAWTSYIRGAFRFGLQAQRYATVAQPLQAMNAPFVYAPFMVSNGVYQPQLQISWPFQAGVSVEHYDVYVDSAATPAASLTTNVWLMTTANGLTTSSAHSFQLDYVTTDGRRSPLSAATTGRTWSGYNWGGIPFEWMTSYYGSDVSKWPVSGTDLANGGPTVLQVFLSGGNPLNPSTWLRTKLVSTPQGYFLSWGPHPGLIYQVQTSTNLSDWVNLGAPRFAAGSEDSIFVGQGNRGYYRLLLLR